MKKAQIVRKRVVPSEETISQYLSSNHSFSCVPLDCWKFIFNCGPLLEFLGIQLASKWLLSLFWDCVTTIDIETENIQLVLYCLSNCNVHLVTSASIKLPTLTNPILKQLGRLHRLENLDICGNIQSIDNFKHLTNIKTLRVNGRFPKPFLPMCGSWTQLEKLEIYTSSLKVDDIVPLMPIYEKHNNVVVGWNREEIINLREIYTLNVSLKYLDYIKYFPDIRTLYVQATIKENCHNQLMKLAEAKTLVLLTITNWNISKQTIYALIDLMPRLLAINLTQCRNFGHVKLDSKNGVAIDMPYWSGDRREISKKPKLWQKTW